MLELPAHLPASPDVYESPRLATHGVPDPGPSAAAGPASATAVSPLVVSAAARTPALRRWRAKIMGSLPLNNFVESRVVAAARSSVAPLSGTG